jgi:hypothetical protein
MKLTDQEILRAAAAICEKHPNVAFTKSSALACRSLANYIDHLEGLAPHDPLTVVVPTRRE